jgi:hypothetical protein
VAILNKIKNHNNMKILKLNSKIALIAPLLLMVFLLQNCKKTAVSPTRRPPVGSMVAYINDTAWIAKQFNAQIILIVDSVHGFSSKTFSLYGASGNKQINLSAVQDGAPNTTGFPLNTYKYDYSFNLGVGPPTSNTFYSSGFTAIVPGASVEPLLLITAIDSVHQTISGTFSFPVYINQNISIVNGQRDFGPPYATITSGKFTSIPYTYNIDKVIIN